MTETAERAAPAGGEEGMRATPHAIMVAALEPALRNGLASDRTYRILAALQKAGWSIVPATELAEARAALAEAEERGENRAYAQVVRSARKVFAHEGNDFSDRHAVMTFAERFLDRAILDDPNAARTVEGGHHDG